MNAHGKAGRAARIVGAALALVLTHTATADDVMIVYGKRVAVTEERAVAVPAFDPEGFRVALHDDIRASLRESVLALRTEIATEKAAARDVRIASLGTRPDA